MALTCPLRTTHYVSQENFPENHIINPLLTNLVWSRCLHIGLFFSCEFDTISIHIKQINLVILTSHLLNRPCKWLLPAAVLKYYQSFFVERGSGQMVSDLTSGMKLPCHCFAFLGYYTFKNWLMLSVRISSFGRCTREVWRARKKRKKTLAS